MPTSSKKKATPRRTTQKHYRNIREIPASFRLEESDRKISLAPRGQRGDLAPIKKGELQDPVFLANKDLLFQVVTDEEAKAIIEKQTTNQQSDRRHPSLEVIRNANGDEYDNESVRVAGNPDDLGVVIQDNLEDGQIPMARQGTNGVQITRSRVPGTEDNPLQHVPDSVSPEDQAEYLRNLRSKTTRG